MPGAELTKSAHPTAGTLLAQGDAGDSDASGGDGPRGPTLRAFGTGVELRHLIAAGVVAAGPGALEMDYLGHIFRGDLASDGTIAAPADDPAHAGSGEGEAAAPRTFAAVSQFALAMAQRVAPERRSMSGWEKVSHRGKCGAFRSAIGLTEKRRGRT